MKQTLFALAIGGLVSLAPAFAQSVISAKAGVIHYVEGDVTVNDQKLVMQVSKFPDLKNKEVLRTEEGRVELLLAPGSFLRLNDKTAVRMDSRPTRATAFWTESTWSPRSYSAEFASLRMHSERA